MMLYIILINSIIGFIIGWFTNWIVVKYLFHPRKPFLGIKLIWGIIPSRRQYLIDNISRVASEKIATPNSIKKHFGIDNEFKLFKGDGIFEDILNSVAEEYSTDILSNKKLFNIREFVSKQLSSFDEEELENVIIDVINKELKLIIWFGGFLGFIFGALAGIIILLLI